MNYDDFMDLSMEGGKTPGKVPKKNYTLVLPGNKTYGIYSSAQPRRAAAKAANYLMDKEKSNKVKVTIRQVSRGRGHNQVRVYEVERIKNPDTKPIIRNGRKIVYKWKKTIKHLKTIPAPTKK
jgi:hypothetical protein